MTPFVSDPDFTLYVGDALEVLAELPAESVHCCVTSPPYLGLRDYAVEGQLGLEATIGAYVAALVDVFAEVRRVLRDDATLWLNLGDSYATGTSADRNPTSLTGAAVPASWAGRSQSVRRHPEGLKPKDLMGMPWRVALALQADGWYLRSDIIWSKPNPMPESVTDRPTKAHEYVFLLSKSPRYFFDQEAVREPHSDARPLTPSPTQANIPNRGLNPGMNGRNLGVLGNPAGRNLRSVWEIATQPYPDAHFATFPEALPERCIKAGTSERGCCPECGAPWVRDVVVQQIPDKGGGSVADRQFSADPRDSGKVRGWGEQRTRRVAETTGWSSACDCYGLTTDEDGCDEVIHYSPVPCTVFDPFMGSGTTALVARRLGRRSIGIELSEEYARMAAQRLQQLSLLAEPA